MKKILTLTILVLLSVTARAQYIDGVPQLSLGAQPSGIGLGIRF